MNQAHLTGNQPLQGLDACHDSDDLLDIGLNGLSEDEQEELSSDQYTAAAQWPSKSTHPSSHCAIAQLKGFP